jgi:glutamate-1-semialdehyde 2,1-aminomutase
MTLAHLSCEKPHARMATVPLTTPIDTALRTRAARVVPGGMTGHLNAAYLPPGYPQFFARGDGWGCGTWTAANR